MLLDAIIILSDHHALWILLQLYGGTSPYKNPFCLDDADFYATFYTQETSELIFDLSRLGEIFFQQTRILERALALAYTNNGTVVGPTKLEELVDRTALLLGKKVHDPPLLADGFFPQKRILFFPPSMHNVFAISKAVLDNMLKFVIPPDSQHYRSFMRHIAGAKDINERGKITASVATYRHLIAL